MKATWLLPLPLALLAAAVPLSGCSSNKNHAEREATPEAQANPESSPLIDDLLDGVETCIGSCLPDPGSKPVDCAKEQAGFEFAWAWNYTRDSRAIATYTYDDNTAHVLSPQRNGWEPKPFPTELCGPNQAVRFRGGQFKEYGGGFGMSFVTVSNLRTNMTLPASEEFPGEGVDGAYDLREWDGVALWVRRGPNGQATMRVGLTERNSSEDLNTSNIDPVTLAMTNPEKDSKYCQRYRLCGCAAGTPCTKVSETSSICWDPEASPMPPTTAVSCGTPRCNEKNTSTDVKDSLFQGRACEVAVTSDGLTNSYCYNPGVDADPPAKRERCGNPFSRPINVGLDWQLIKVPFTELRQADEANVAGEMDLASVKQLVFTHTTGWIDFWVANVGFYRSAP